jgi:hypothetical protein
MSSIVTVAFASLPSPSFKLIFLPEFETSMGLFAEFKFTYVISYVCPDSTETSFVSDPLSPDLVQVFPLIVIESNATPFVLGLSSQETFIFI